MATNSYFRSNLNGNGEQHLINDLLTEAIKIYGLDCEYIPYELRNEDKLYGEDTLLQYTHAYPLEMYIESVTGFDGQNDFLSKFGLQIEEKANLMVARTRFRQAVNFTQYRPREKDLIYFPLTDSLYEITFVEHEKIFHQVGALQVYSMRIDLFNYAHQKIKTGVRYIDKFEDEKAFAIDLQMAATGTSRYLLGEQVFQGASLATATAVGTVIFFNRDTKILQIKDIKGDFVDTSPVIGVTSGANYALTSFDIKAQPNDPIADNKQIKDEANSGVIDWTEKNPFGDNSK